MARRIGRIARMSGDLPQVYLADRVIDRIRAVSSDAPVFAHRDILRVLAARWLNLHAVEARRVYLTTASLSILGYHHDLDEPVIRLWNDARH
jgi:broad specificity phosphatase PhoE